MSEPEPEVTSEEPPPEEMFITAMPPEYPDVNFDPSHDTGAPRT